VPVLPLAIAAPDSRERHPFAHRGVWQGGYPINLVCVNADALPGFAHEAGPGFFEHRDTIGWWWWELAEFPEQWLGSFRHVDELWAGSHFVAEAFAAVAPVPVTRVPVPVSVTGSPRPQRERLGLPGGFLFLFAFDHRSVLARKNPLGVIDAFLQAFPEPGEASLVLKSINGEQRPDDRDRVLRAAAGHRHIVVRDEYLEPPDKDRLVASCDCYVSLHRSEGFGMTMAEAMFLGKPVIATGYSGNLDYMTPENSWLVDYRLTEIGPGADPYMPGARWADPNVEHAAALMRAVVEDPEEAERRAQRGARDIRRAHSPAVAGAQMAKLLRDIATRVPAARGDWENSRAREHVRGADELVRAGSQLGPGSRAGAARRGLRRLVLRVMKPHIAHQRRIDGAVIDALEELTAEIRALTERGFAVEALSLAGLRDVERRLRELVAAELAAQSKRIDGLTRDDASVS
jgi:glycosyltransferase involved in cell wall biosynthesis